MTLYTALVIAGMALGAINVFRQMAEQGRQREQQQRNRRR